MHPELTLVLLFSIATAVALLVRRTRVPYTVALVLAGLGLGALHWKTGAHLTKDLVFSVFLPGLVFEASYHLRFADLRANARSILVLAVPGVVVSMAATAGMLLWGGPAFGTKLALGSALVFSALIAATDPIAVVALFKTLGAPKRLGILVESESLVNDGTAIVLFTIVLASVGTGHFDVTEGAIDFVRITGFGVLVGAVFGSVASFVVRRVDEPMIEITVSTIVAYGSFAVAEEIHASGVIATVTAATFFGSYAASSAMSLRTRTALEAFWEYIAFALNSLVFLLIGLTVSIQALAAAWKPILLAFVAVTLARAAVVAVGTAVVRPTTERIPLKWAVMLTWGGLRGALSMVLALSLAPDFPDRDLLVTMTFGVVIVSIVLQGATSGPVLRRLGLVESAS